MPKKLALTAPNTWNFILSEHRSLEPDEIRIKTKLTGLRHGYDCAYANASCQQMIQFPWIPKTWGLGEIIEIGSQVKQYQLGEMVHGLVYHQEESILKENQAYPKKWLRDEFTLFMEPAILAIKAIRATHVRFGDNAIVLGLGTLGLLTIQFLTLSGVQKIIAIDPIPQRQKLAQRLGATTIASTVSQVNKLDSSLFESITAIYDFSTEWNLQDDLLQKIPSHCRYIYCPTLLNYELEKTAVWKEKYTNVSIIELNVDQRDSSIEHLALEMLASKKVIVWPIPCKFFPFEKAHEAFHFIRNQPEFYIKTALVYEKMIEKTEDI